MKIRKKELRDLALLLAKPSVHICVEAIASEPDYTMTQRDVFLKLMTSPGIIAKDLLGLEIFGIIDNKQSLTDKREVSYKLNRPKYEKMKQALNLLNEIIEED